MFRRFSLLVVVLAGIGARTTRAETPLAYGHVEELKSTRLAVSVGPTEPEADLIIDQKVVPGLQQASSVRLRFGAIIGSGEGDYNVQVLDQNDRQIDNIHGRSITAMSGQWSQEYYGHYLRLHLSSGSSNQSRLDFRIDAVGYDIRDKAVRFSILHVPPSLEPISHYSGVPAIVRAARAIGKLIFADGADLDSCSGFLVSMDEFVTNNHCVSSEEACIQGAVVIFGYEEDEKGVISQGTQYRCEALPVHNATLDFSILRLSGRPGDKWGWLHVSGRTARAGEQAFIIQHPGGDPKQIARKGCAISTPAFGNDLGHSCDTATGSSGSPVLDSTLKVIGLHHLGFTSDLRWKAENRAVRASKFLDSIPAP